jgi:DNA polymerase I-like protein with 3'-5' exonuclease and polymerase domains
VNLFDIIDDSDPQPIAHKLRETAITTDWCPRDPPRIASAGIREIFADYETTGLKWWAGHRPVGLGVLLPDGTSDYLAWGHRGGKNNLTEAQFVAWANEELRDVRWTNLNTRFEGHMSRVIGIDTERLGITFSDVGHYAALLDDHRFSFSQEALVHEFLKDEEKVKQVNGVTLDMTRVAQYPADVIGVRAMADVRQVKKLKDVFWPMLDKEGLQNVRRLEDDFIRVVIEMEKNGSPIDLVLLDKWSREIPQKCEEILYQLKKNLGFYIDPGTTNGMVKLFNHEKLPMTERTDTGQPSFKSAYLATFPHNENVQLARRYRSLKSLEAKYLKKYARNHVNGVIYYAIHQLRSIKDETDEDAAGTITGRCSSSAFTWKDKGKKHEFGVNIQQVAKPVKQIKRQGHDDYIIRELHIPTPGNQWLSADARQIEYRLFAHYANNPKMIQRYKDDPLLSYHEEMHGDLKPYVPDITYGQTKDVNFAYIYAAGVAKMGWMLSYITETELKEIRRNGTQRTDPRLDPVREIRKIYARINPEVEPLLRRASHLAMPKCNEYCRQWDHLHKTEKHRGYIMTLDGRRGRFPTGDRVHKALNMVIQGGAASIAKRKAIDLHNARDYTGLQLCFVVHDENDGIVSPDPIHAKRVQEVLDTQSFPLRVPILWDVNTGVNWRACGDD